MILVILAAGTGRRLSGSEGSPPKLLLPVAEGRCIFDLVQESVERTARVESILVVVGYRAEEVEATILGGRHAKPVAVQYNPFYTHAGPIASIWTTRIWERGEDFLICNGDTYYGAGALAKMTASVTPGVNLGIERCHDFGSDDMKIVLSGTGMLARVGKGVPAKSADGRSSGLLAVTGKDRLRAFGEILEMMMRSDEYLAASNPWHSVCNVMIERGIPIGAILLEPHEWHEIDTGLDIQALEAKLGSVVRPKPR